MTDSHDDRSATHAGRAAEAVRVFVDADGTRWQVSERHFSDYDRRRGRSLIFASDAAVRRVRDYPDDWYSLSDAELSALSWKS